MNKITIRVNGEPVEIETNGTVVSVGGESFYVPHTMIRVFANPLTDAESRVKYIKLIRAATGWGLYACKIAMEKLSGPIEYDLETTKVTYLAPTVEYLDIPCLNTGFAGSFWANVTGMGFKTGDRH